MVKRLPLLVKLAPVYLIIGAMFLMNAVAAHHHSAQVKAAGLQASHAIASSASAPTKPLIQGNPVRILIPNVSVDVKVVNGYYNSQAQAWSVAHDYANFATITPLPSSKSGTPLIYGHWFEQVFGNTKNLQPGDIAYVYTDNNHILAYKYTGADIVDPTDTQIFNHAADGHGLTLMTCDGAWAQHRRFMNFTYQGAV